MDELTCMIGGAFELIKGVVVMALVNALLIAVKFLERGEAHYLSWLLLLLLR